MRVRVKFEPDNGWYRIEYKYWWWPFWFSYTIDSNEKRAISMAEKVKHPDILEIM